MNKRLDIINKKINFLGDSITAGAGNSCQNNIYLNVMKSEVPLAEARNYGVCGTRFAKQHVPSSNAMYDRDFVSRIDEMDEDADIIVVFGGTNDYGHGDAPLGNIYDRTQDTFYGACHVLMTKLINKFPFSTIIIITPLHRLNEENFRGEGNKKNDVAPLSVYVDIIKEVAGYYALPVLDLFNISGIQPNVPVIRKIYCPDGIHPNDAGHRIIASRLTQFLKSL